MQHLELFKRKINENLSSTSLGEVATAALLSVSLPHHMILDHPSERLMKKERAQRSRNASCLDSTSLEL
jgi:hypothetical protein